jgi:RNA polymerase sigma-70 factor (ECF subfamily)
MAEKSSTAEAVAKFQVILDEYGKLLRNTIARLCPKDLGIEFDDIEQEAHLRLWRTLQRATEVADFPSYLYRIAVSTTLDAVRRVRTRREEQLLLEEKDEGEGGISSLQVDPEKSPDRIAEQRQRLRQVEAALAQLPENHRRAIELYLQGLTSQEIAELQGWHEPKARSLLYRGLKELRRRLSIPR